MLLCQTVEECVSPIEECLRRLGAEASHNTDLHLGAQCHEQCGTVCCGKPKPCVTAALSGQNCQP